MLDFPNLKDLENLLSTMYFLNKAFSETYIGSIANELIAL